jgi:hypothetical protein
LPINGKDKMGIDVYDLPEKKRATLGPFPHPAFACCWRVMHSEVSDSWAKISS